MLPKIIDMQCSRARKSVAQAATASRPRLSALGFDVPSIESAEHRLYELLASSDPDSAHSRYNALVRRLVSFERAMECARRQTRDA